MISYLILSLLGICSNLQANLRIPNFAKWLTVSAYKSNIIGPDSFLHTGIGPFILFNWIIIFILLALTVLIEYYIMRKLIPQGSNIRMLIATTMGNIVSGLFGIIPLLIIDFILPVRLSHYLELFLHNDNPKTFINDPALVAGWLAFYLIANLIIEAPIIRAFFRQTPFKRILFVTFIANLASNIAFFILLKVAALIWS